MPPPPVLTPELRRRGGLARWAHVSPLDRARALRDVVGARWARTSPEKRRRQALALVQARLAWEPAPPLPARVVPQACHTPRGCERCGRPATPWCRPPRTLAAWRWRCPRHAPR